MNTNLGAESDASRLIDERIRELGGWRGETLARMRALILEAGPEMTEEWKWTTPVWSHHGIVCTKVKVGARSGKPTIRYESWSLVVFPDLAPTFCREV